MKSILVLVLVLVLVIESARTVASPTPRAEWEQIDVSRLLARKIPPIVQRILALAKTYRPGVIRFGSSEGESKMRLGDDWDVFRFKFGQGGGTILVLLSEADEVALVGYCTSPELVGRQVAEAVRRDGLKSIATLWGVRVEWGEPAPADNADEPETPR